MEMRISLRVVLPALLAGWSLLCAGPRARAVVADTGTASDDTGLPPDSAGLPYDNVGMVGEASGVYLGNGYVITAAHVGGGAFTTGGNTYSYDPNSVVQLKNGDGSTADMIVFRLTGNFPPLPSLQLATGAPLMGTFFYMAGFGYYRAGAYGPDSNADSGFYLSANHAKSFGTNTVGGTAAAGSIQGLNVDSFYSDFSQNGTVDEAQVANGDSGGAEFGFDAADGKYDILLGVTDAQAQIEDSQRPSNVALFGDYSLFADMSQYASQINAITVPSPVVSAVTMSGGNIKLTVPTLTGHTYQLQQSASLTPAVWQNTGSSQAGSGAPLDFTATAQGTVQFYRVLVSPWP